MSFPTCNVVCFGHPILGCYTWFLRESFVGEGLLPIGAYARVVGDSHDHYWDGPGTV